MKPRPQGLSRSAPANWGRTLFLALLTTTAMVGHAAGQHQADSEFNVRVTINARQVGRNGFGYVALHAGYVDGTPAALKCDMCPGLAPGQYHGRWDKDKLRVRWAETFGGRKVHEDKYEVSFSEPKRDTAWSRTTPVLITAYGMSEQECMLPIRLAYNVIDKIDHPASWRIVLACTAASWEKAALEFHTLGGTRIAFTLWDRPQIPGKSTVMTVLNAEQFERCMRPGCYVHTILHELGHFRSVSGDEELAEAFVAEQEAILHREHPQTDFPSREEVVNCALSRDDQCPITGDMAQLVQALRRSRPLEQATAAAAAKSGQVYVSANGVDRATTEDQSRLRAAVSAAAAKAPPVAKPIVVNADVISMVGLGLSTDVIVAKINVSECRFDTSPTDLQQLKAAQVPDTIVMEVIKCGTK